MPGFSRSQIIHNSLSDNRLGLTKIYFEENPPHASGIARINDLAAIGADLFEIFRETVPVWDARSGDCSLVGLRNVFPNLVQPGTGG